MKPTCLDLSPSTCLTNNIGEDPMGDVNDLSLHDFMNETNFEQFIALIRGESADPIVKFCPNYECEHINGCLVDNQQFDFNAARVADPNSIVDSLPWDLMGEEGENDGEEYSSATMTTTTTTTTKRSTKVDRSRTLISERRRRGRMKEKLYALRSLVPNITKMDKASIVGDAALYVQDLQMQANKLRAEIAGLELSLSGVENYHEGSYDNAKKIQVTNSNSIHKKILKMDLFQVEERVFHVRLVCNKGQGVAPSLYKALESFTSFNVQTSNLASDADNFVLTFTLKVGECELDMNLPNLKLWVAAALLNQGFDFKTSPSA